VSKTFKFLIYFIIFDIVVIGAYLGFKIFKSGGKAGVGEYPWVTIDASYAPHNAVEEFIKNDAQARGAFPVYIRNYGHNTKILKKFRGRQFAQPSENVLSLFFKGLDDWMLIDIKYKNEKEQEVQRTVLYIFENKQWKVGDSGTLLK